VEVLLVAAALFLAWRAGIFNGIGPSSSLIGTLSPTPTSSLISPSGSVASPLLQGAVETQAPPCSVNVAQQLTNITGIETPVASVPFDTLPGAGAVTIGGIAATTGYNPQGGSATDAELVMASKLATSAVGMVAAAGAALSGGGAAFAATALGTAIPFIGIGIAVLATVVGMIAQHHQIALANEGKVLNTTDPNALAAFVLVVQAVINGEITSIAEAQMYTQQIVADWYGQVKSIQRGMWTYQGEQFPEPSYADSYASRTGPYGSSSTNTDSHAPDPCNAACVVGHYFIERGAFVTLAAAKDILAGNHNISTFPVLPPHDTQSGVPQIQVMY